MAEWKVAMLDYLLANLMVDWKVELRVVQKADE